jgi:ribA/ribD-fused uncharacterized protein
MVEAEKTRTPGARHVTFLVKHVRERIHNGYVFFYSATSKYGGPFDFLSNFYKSEFTVPHIGGNYRFKSMEQFYQFSKTQTFKWAKEVIVALPNSDLEISSYDLSHVVLDLDYPLRTAEVVRHFVEAGRKQSEAWYEKWFEIWSNAIPKVLRVGLEAKFRDNPALTESLMLTGDYELVEASPTDSNCGIGFSAARAFDNRDHWEADLTRNLLGKALMQLRRDIYDGAKEDKKWPQEYHRLHYSSKELRYWEDLVERQKSKK